MHILKTFFITIKYHIAGIFIYLGIFIALLVFFTQNDNGQPPKAFTATQLDILIQDEDHTVLSQSLYDFLESRHRVEKGASSREDVIDKLYWHTIDYSLRIPKGFQADLLSGRNKDLVENTKLPESATGYWADAQIEQYLTLLNSYLAGGYSPEDAARLSLETSEKEARINMASASAAENNSTIVSFYHYLVYILISLVTTGLGQVLITFRQRELDIRFRCSPCPASRRSLFLALGGLLFSVACWLLCMMLGVVLFPKSVFTITNLLYMINSLVFLLFVMSLTLLISFLTENFNILQALTNISGLTLSFLGGVFVPQEFMNETILRFSRLLPSYWYIKAMDLISSSALTSHQYQEYLSCLGIQVLFAAAVLAGAMVVSKYQKIQ